MQVDYSNSLGTVEAADLAPFDMLGTTPERLLSMLRGSEQVAIARSGGRVVGYGAAIGDGTLFAFLTSLEVLREHRGQGIGSALVRLLQERLRDRYAFDLACDEHLVPFCESLGLKRGVAMLSRNYRALG